MSKKILVWDFPTRFFHWCLVFAIGFQYVTAELLDDSIQLHFYGGYVTLGLILFRLFWGIWGAYHAKFIHFVASPKTTYKYAKSLAFNDTPMHLGHNPMGAFSVIAILAIISTQAVSGLFITDDIFHQGPYYSAVSSSTQDLANWLHHNLFNAIWVFLVFHLGAMIFYKLVKSQNLVAAMFSGYKDADSLSEEHAAKNDKSKAIPKVSHHWLRFFVTVAICAVLVYCIVVVWAPELSDDFYY